MQHVTFPTLSPFLLRDLRTRSKESLASAGQGNLYLPSEPSSRRPAVVIVEGLGGLKPARECAYGEFLARHGYVALVIDSFATRRAAWLPDNIRGMLVTEAMMCADAYAALRYLSGHPAVDPERVSVMGFSYGGMISVLAAYEQIRQLLAEGSERFAGFVSYYGCSIPRLEDPTTTGAPVLILLGALDRNVSVARTKLIAEDLRRGGSPVDLRILPKVYHQWDGADVTKRFVRFNLRRFAFRLDRNNEAFDEASGMRVRGPLTRTWAMLLRSDPRGYHILRDEAAIARTNAMLLSFLAGAGAGQADAGPGSGATREARSAARSRATTV